MKAVYIVSFFIIIFITSCVTIAPPPPMVTYGGPKTTPESTSEMAVAVGTGVALFEGAHSGAQGYFLRYKYGLNDKFDIGMDWVGANRNDGLYLSTKLATRYQVANNHRLEFGFGVADDSDGKSINGDIAYTVGTTNNKTWNYYSSLRLGYAHGYPGNAIFGNQPTQPADTIAPPNTIFGLINLGAQAEINETQKFIFEGGYGYIFPEGTKSGPSFYVSAGLLFNVGKKKK